MFHKPAMAWTVIRVNVYVSTEFIYTAYFQAVVVSFKSLLWRHNTKIYRKMGIQLPRVLFFMKGQFYQKKCKGEIS